MNKLLLTIVLAVAFIYSAYANSCVATIDGNDIFQSNLELRSGKSGLVIQDYTIKNHYSDIDIVSNPSKVYFRLQPQGSCTAAAVKLFDSVADARVYPTIRIVSSGSGSTATKKYMYSPKYGEAAQEIDSKYTSEIADSKLQSGVNLDDIAEGSIYLMNLKCNENDKKIVKMHVVRKLAANSYTLRWDILQDTRGGSECMIQSNDEGRSVNINSLVDQFMGPIGYLFGSTTTLWVFFFFLLSLIGCMSICMCVMCCCINKNKQCASKAPAGVPVAVPVQSVPVHSVPVHQPQVVYSEATPLYPQYQHQV